MEPDNRDLLYDNLINSKKVTENEIGTRDQFKNYVYDEESTRQFYKNLSNSGKFNENDIGTEDQFYDILKSDFASPEDIPDTEPSDTTQVEQPGQQLLDQVQQPNNAWRDEMVETGINRKTGEVLKEKKGNIYDNLYKVFGDAMTTAKPGDQSAYAQARSAAEQMGVGDMNTLMRLVGRVNVDYAREQAKKAVADIVAKLPERSADPMADLQAVYYDKDIQKQLHNVANTMGNDYEDIVNKFVKPQLAQAIKMKYGGDDNEWIGVKGLHSNWADVNDRWEREHVGDLLGEIYDTTVKDALDAGEAKRKQVLDSSVKSQATNPFFDSQGFNLGNLMLSHRQANEAADPAVILQSLIENMSGAATTILQDEKTFEDIWQRASAKGMDVNDYIEKYVVPQMQQTLVERFEKEAVSREMPKSTTEYILNGLTKDNVAAMLVNKLVRTEAQNRYASMADMLTEEGKNPDVDPGLLAEGARLAAGMAADFWLWGGWGKIGGKAAEALLSRRLTELAVSRGLTEAAAREVMMQEAKHSLKGRALQQVMQHIPQSVVMGTGASTTTGVARGIRDNEDLGTIITNAIKELPGHVLTFGAFGTANALTNSMAANWKGWKKLLGKALGYEGSALTLYGTGEMSKAMNGQDAFEQIPEGLLKAHIDQLAMHFASNPGKAVGDLFKAVRHPVKWAGTSDTENTKGVLTEEDVADLMESSDGRALWEVLSDMKPKTSTEAVKDNTAPGVHGTEETAARLAEWLNNKDRPADRKRRVGSLLGFVVPKQLETSSDMTTADDGTVTLRTRDKDGNCVQELHFDTKDEADQWQQEHQQQLEMNDMRELWNGTNKERRLAAVLKMMTEMGLEKPADIQAIFDGKGDAEQTAALYNALKEVAVRDDEPNAPRFYEEGRKLSLEEQHDASVKEQRVFKLIEGQGEEFANDVLAGRDNPDVALPQIREKYGDVKARMATIYYNNYARTKGVMDEINTEVDNAVKAANERVYQNAHPSGNVIAVTADNKPAFLTDGDVTINADGTINTNGHNTIIVRDAETGDVKMVDPANLEVTGVYSESDLIRQNEEIFRQQLEKKALDNVKYAPGTPEQAMLGDIYTAEDGMRYMVGWDENTGKLIKIALDESGQPVEGDVQPLDVEEYRTAKSAEIDTQTYPDDQFDTSDIEPMESADTERIPLVDNEEEKPSGYRIPTNDKGQPEFVKAQPEQTRQYFIDKYGEEKADSMFARLAENTAKAYDKLVEKGYPDTTDPNELMAYEDELAETKKEADYWQSLTKKKEEKPAEAPVAEVKVEQPKVEEQPAAVETKPAEVKAEQPKVEKPADAPAKPKVEQPKKAEKKPEPEQPKQPTAEEKIANGSVRANIGRTFNIDNTDGSRLEIKVDRATSDGKTEVTQQLYDAKGNPVGEPEKKVYSTLDVGNGIISKRMKPVLDTEGKLREAFKGKVAMQNMIDVLSDEEQKRMLDTYEKGDNDAFSDLMSEFRENHKEDLILRERDNRNSEVDKILNGPGSREQKLRQIRKQYQGYDDAETQLSDETMQPTTLEEYISDLHSRVPKQGEGTIAYYSYETPDGHKIIGLKDETGFGKKSGEDTKGFAPWLAKQGEGMSLQQYAENIHSQLPEAVQQQYDVQDVRNAIRDVFGAAERPSDIPLMIVRRGVLQAEQAARRMEEQWIDSPSYQKVSPDDKSFAGRLARAKQTTNTEPTEAQKEKGNYKKGHVSFGGYDYVIENPEGSMRRGKDADGKEWEQKMNNTYGYILGKYGKDGDHLDMFINDAQDLDNWNGKVYVVDQVDPKTGQFDEHKVMYGFNSEDEARDAYLSNYEKGWKGLGRITGVSKEAFDKWLDSSKRKKIEFADHSITKEALEKETKQAPTDAEIDVAMRDELIDEAKTAGVDISTNYEADQALLDRVNGSKDLKQQTTEETIKSHKVDDAEELKQLENQPTVKRYRAMQLIDGKLYPPMSAKVDGEMRQPTEIGVWEKAEERPDLVKNGKFVLNKAQKGQGNVPAAYNPYFHTSTSGLNDQFTSAYKRPELVVVEVEIPESELTSGYKAEGAKDAVGDVSWHSGVVNGQLPADRQRQVTLSRYSKVNRIVPDSEVAEMIAKQLEGTNVEVPYNVVTPSLRAELEKKGVKISNKPAGSVTEDANGNRIRQQKAEAPIFVSNALKAVEAIKQDKATSDQWLAMIQKNGGLKAGEDKWIGLSDWLTEQKKSGKSVTKQEILDYIRQNQIEVEEQKYSEGSILDDNPKMQEFRAEFDKILDDLKNGQGDLKKEMEDFENEMYDKYGYGWANELNDEEREIFEAQNDKYYSDEEELLDAAFREMVNRHGDDFEQAFKVDYNHSMLDAEEDMYGDGLSDAAKYYLDFDNWNEKPIDGVRMRYTTEGLKNKKEIALTVPSIEPYEEGDKTHFGDAGEGRAVAWIRFGETTDPDGKRVLVIDEIQSKRHQDARGIGYKEENKAKLKELKEKIDRFDIDHPEFNEMLNKWNRNEISKEEMEAWREKPENKEIINNQMALWDEHDKLSRELALAIPDAPFEKNWHELAMKRMLRYAAENGYDKIAWTTGDQQAERYSLSKAVRSVRRSTKVMGPDWFTLVPQGGAQMRFHVGEDGKVDRVSAGGMESMIGHSLSELFGKDVAPKIEALNDNEALDFENQKIGGEGMRGFYDQILPRFMDKYGKKWGVKVKQTEMPKGVYDPRWADHQPLTMHSIDVTPEMKESVMEGQPMFFKTPEGYAYGFTYQGKIHIDPRIATSETPIHEYGHLWAEMKRQSAPEEWEQIKQTLLTDEVVKPFIEKVKRDYPELTGEGKEDSFIEEVLTQYSGKHGAEKLRQTAEEIKNELGDDADAQTIAEAAISRVKQWLNKFWESVADMMGWKYKKAEDIADAVLRDLLNGVNPTEKMKEASAEVKGQNEVERTLMGVHNISEEKLKKALKLGGLANPSMAVIDTKNGIHTDYGEISLIPRSSLIDAKTGRNAGTYAGDAWTPTYPNVTKEMTSKGEKHKNQIAKEAAGGNEELAQHLARTMERYVDDNENRLHLLYLLQKGIKPDLIPETTTHNHDEYEELRKILGNDQLRYSSDGLTKEQNDAILDLMMKGVREKAEESSKLIKDEEKRQKAIETMVKMRLDSLVDPETGKIWFAKYDTYIYDVLRDEKRRQNPKIDWYKTDNEASYRVAKENLAEDYEAWKELLFGDEDITEKLFAGWTPDGTKKYVKNTVENASRLMNKEKDTNAYGNGGLSASKAMLVKKLKSLAEIRKYRHLIKKGDDIKEQLKQKEDEWFDIIEQVSHMQKVDSNPFINNDIAEARLQEAMEQRDPIAYMNKEYGYHIDKDGELASQLMNFMEEASQIPVKYFETKFKRPVGIEEFAIAVVPTTTSPEVIKALKDKGLEVRTYEKGSHGDEKDEARKQAVMDAVNSRDDILFQKVESEENIKDEESRRDSEKKERPLHEMPLKSSERFNGDHVKGLEEYEDELRTKLAANPVEGGINTYTSSRVSGNPVDGFWDERQAKEGLEAGPDRLHVGEPVEANGQRLGISQEERKDIEDKLAAIEKEKERRKQAWDDFAKKYHVSADGWIWYKDYLKAFDDMNTDPEAKRLMDKVVSVLEGDLGELSIKAGLTERGNHKDGLFGDIDISQDWITRGVSDSEKAKTLLHELLHKVTIDNIELYSIPGFRHLMSKEAREAVKELYAIHDALSEKYPDTYGSKDVKEMVAEMGDANLRKALQDITYDKNKNVTLWDRFKAAIKRFFTKDAEAEIVGDADKAAMEALDKLLDAYDKHRSTIQRTGRTAKSIAERVAFGGESSTDNRYYSEESELTPEKEQYWKDWEKAMNKWKERNGIPAEVKEAPEKPAWIQGEPIFDFAKRMADWNIQNALWKTAPKLENYRQAREDRVISDEAHNAELQGDDLSTRNGKARRVAADLQRIRHAMSRQKAYDKETVKAVTDFAQDFMKMGFGDNLSRGEMERMLSSVKNATGAKSIKNEVDNIMNILLDNHLRNLDQRIQKLSSVKELSKTAQGVEKQGKLELKGQRMIQAFREAREGRMDAETLRQRLYEVAEKMSKNDEEAPMWEQEYEGLSIALQYQENIEASRDEWAELDREYKDAVKNYKTSGRTYEEQQQLLESLDKAMMENKMERIAMFGDIIGRLEGNISESMKGAKEFVEREKQRVAHIHQIANADLAGKNMGALRVNSGKPANFFLQPLGTFEQILKMLGARNAKGEGNLYDYFMRNWMDSIDKSYTNETKAKEELDEKAREIFGDKVKRWSDLYEITRKMEPMEVELLDGEERKTFNLTPGNLMYIYMANKMNDGKMKLRKMGIDEEKVEAIKDHLDPRLIELADWLQEEYLPIKRTEYNKVHERMFGAPMAAIEHYFPIKILGDARVKEEDVNVPDAETLPSTITGNIIKRRKNTLPLDILNTDALSLAVEHIEDMERWAATAEWNKDVNTLLSYTTFRNKVKNMDTIYGSGDALWNNFKNAARMAAGTYNPSAKAGGVDKAVSNIAKGVTAAKINFRVYTAFKQILSAPAFLHDVNLGDFVKYAANPLGSWKWAMENMPVFQKRWKSRQAGDTRLMDDPTDWKMWKNNVVQLATRLGMSANGFVDGVTCAVGARAIYETRYKKYINMGASEEKAHKRALQDAEIGYNLTQQSSEGAFVSAIQKDRTVMANMLSVFRNSSMAYTRQWVDAARNLSHRMQDGYKEDSIDFMTNQLQSQLGLDENQAREAAEAEYNRAGRHEVAKLLNMMFGVTTMWNLGASLPYLLLGDDNKLKKEMLTDAMMKGMFAGATEGLAAGNIISDFVALATNEKVRKSFKNEGLWSGMGTALDNMGEHEINPLPLFADIEQTIGKMKYDGFAAAQDVFNLCMQSAVGVNPQTFTDMWNACMDYGMPGWDGQNYSSDPDNWKKPKEIALFIMRLLNAPASSWKNKYIDELGMTVDEAKKLPYEEMARRYAHYKHWKDVPFMGWLRGEEGREAKMEKIQQQFDKAVQERMDRLTDDEINSNLVRSQDIEERRKYAKMIAQRMGYSTYVDAKKADDDHWYQKDYQRLMQYNDIKEDEILADKVRNLKKRKLQADKKVLSEIDKLMDWIRDGKYDSKSGRPSKSKQYNLMEPGKNSFDANDPEKNEAVMKNIRKWRKEALELAEKAEKLDTKE